MPKELTLDGSRVWKPIILKKWQTHFRFEKESQASIPTSVHTYNFPLEYWNPDGLSLTASAIGRPVMVDKMTTACRGISYARVEIVI